jgi:opacity protein-like surface antigen
MSVSIKYQIDREFLQNGVPTNAKYSEILLGYNYYWSLGSALEVFLGLNYSLPRQSGTGWAAGVTLESFLGYQAGLNYIINPNLYLNVEYDVYRANIKFSNGTLNGLEDSGIRVGLGCRL